MASVPEEKITEHGGCPDCPKGKIFEKISRYQIIGKLLIIAIIVLSLILIFNYRFPSNEHMAVLRFAT